MRGWLAVSLCVLALGAGARADQPPPAEARVDDATLLKAINFALTGGDRTTYVFESREQCTVTSSHPSAQEGVQAVETYYLNNVDVSRIEFLKMHSKSQFETEDFIRVQLRGESVVRVTTFAPTTTPALQWTAVSLDLHTDEYQRVIRAWRYIYAHGCKSAKSSF